MIASRKAPTVTVIIPVKNDAERLSVCLNSLAKSSADQLVVVDNGSTDSSLEVAKQAGCITLEAPHAKVGAMRNRGVASSDGEILAFVDSDHELLEEWLEAGVRLLCGDERAVAVGSHYLPPTNGTWVQRAWAVHRLRGASPREVDWLGSGNLFVRRSDFLKVNGFREDLTAAEDVDLCYRLRSELGGRIICDQSIRNIHHGEAKTIGAFFRKEYWRGSSGLRAWASQGFPLRDLPSFLWPLWHLFGLLAVVVLLFAAAVNPTPGWFQGSLLAIGTLFLPSLVLSLKTCWQERRLDCLLTLGILYFVYGLARAAALFKS
ncbi:MAG: glycosyltransferase [Planctomycetota bacterium]